MALFVCQKCKAVENHSCMAPHHSSNKDIKLDERFPNMSLMEMQGMYDEDTYVVNHIGQDAHGPITERVVFKPKDQVMMLCSECNLGKWHGEWEKHYATENDLEVASHSKYNYITPADHDVDLVKNEDGDYTVKLNFKNGKVNKNRRKYEVNAESTDGGFTVWGGPVVMNKPSKSLQKSALGGILSRLGMRVTTKTSKK